MFIMQGQKRKTQTVSERFVESVRLESFTVAAWSSVSSPFW